MILPNPKEPPMIRRFLTAGLAATALFALAACGDDSDKDSVILPGQVTLP